MNTTIQALGWTLIHFCWQAAAVALAYRLIDASFSHARAHVRYLLSLSTVISLLAVAVATFAYEQKRVDVESMSYSLVSADGRTIYAQPDCNAPVAPNVSTGGSVDSFEVGRKFAAEIGDTLLRSVPGDPLIWIDGAWIAGVLALSIRLMGGWMTVRRMRSCSTVSVPPAVHAAFRRLARKMQISCEVDLLICQRIAGPVAIGILRSAVILPAAALSHLSPEQLEVVLAHELAHIRRADYLWNMVQTIVETLFFFHPAVWWLGNRTRQLRELCCDDEAVAACGDPIVYATALLKLEEQRSLRIRLAMALHGNNGSLKSRILRILEGRQGVAGFGRRDSVPLSLAGVAAALGLFLLPLPHVEAGRATSAQEPVNVKLQAEQAQIASQAKAASSQQKIPLQQHPPKTIDEGAMPIQPAAPPALPEIPAVTTAPAPVVVTPSVSVATAVASRVATSTAVQPRISISHMEVSRVISPIGPIAMRVAIAQAPAVGESATDKNYLQSMHDLGYTDIDKLIAMKVQGVTVDYAQRMSKAGYGTISADDLISLKIFGVTPEEAEKFRADVSGDKSSLKQLVQYKIFKVTPEFIAEMKAAGFDGLSPDKLVALRVQNVTPAFASTMKQKFPQLTVDQLIQLKIFRIDDNFIATAKSHGFESLSLEKLIRLRVSGVLDDNSVQR